MDKLKKIHFKTATLNAKQLIERIEHCIDAHDLAVFIHRNSFKYVPYFVEQLHVQFTQAALLYCIVKRFPELIDGQNIDCVALSRQLKEQYTAINLKILKKKDSFFYFLCIYFTKLGSNFLEDTFVDILVEGHLQSQLYISLVYVLLGLQVSPKSYEINHRKVISQPLAFRTKSCFISKTSSIQSVQHKLSTKRTNLLTQASKKIQIKLSVERKPTHLFRAETATPTETQLFKSALKKNLQVAVLPHLPPKKLKASEFDKTILKTLLKESEVSPRNQLAKVESDLAKSSKGFLYSTQNSTSYQMFFKNNDQNICNMHKTVKISHLPQLVQTAGRKIQKCFMNPVKVEQSQNSEKLCETDLRKNWLTIVRNIKQNTIYTAKHNSMPPWEKEDIQNLNTTAKDVTSPAATLHFLLQQQRSHCAREHANANISTKGFLSQSTHLSTEFYDEKEKAIEGDLQDFTRQKSQKYRMQRKVFDLLCNNRKELTAYSLFNAANINNSFVKFGMPHK